jgi:hypothetical protein
LIFEPVVLNKEFPEGRGDWLRGFYEILDSRPSAFQVKRLQVRQRRVTEFARFALGKIGCQVSPGDKLNLFRLCPGFDEFRRPWRLARALLRSNGIARLPSEAIRPLIEDPWEMTEQAELPQEAWEYLRGVVLERIRREFLNACSRDCERVSGETEIESFVSIDETYWHRFSESSTFAVEATRRITIQKRDAPCKIGFPVDRDNGCPLMELPKHSVGELSSIFRKVIDERSARRN